jgi:serine/threonine-protein kinase
VRRRVGAYELIEVLGQGGSSRVFRARHRGAGQEETSDVSLPEVALKVLEKRHLDYEEHLLHLRNEAKFARLVDHSRVVKVLALEEDAAGARLIMELMGGGSLHDLIASGVKISEERLLGTGLEILKVLSAAHDKGILHCDLKPANILFHASGGAKLGDFGLARSTTAEASLESHLMATPDYVAPEILAGERGDFRGDLYGLGGCLYHAMTGHPPYKTDGRSLEELRLLKVRPVKCSSVRWGMLPETGDLISRMLAPDPAARFDSYAALEAVFRSQLDHLAQTKKSTSRRGRRGSGWWRRFFPSPRKGISGTS